MHKVLREYVSVVDHGMPPAPYRQIAAILRAGIESGEYAPGQRLPSITTLMQTYGVAHLTANKALRLLASEGLAVLEPGMGFYVTRLPAPRESQDLAAGQPWPAGYTSFQPSSSQPN